VERVEHSAGAPRQTLSRLRPSGSGLWPSHRPPARAPPHGAARTVRWKSNVAEGVAGPNCRLRTSRNVASPGANPTPHASGTSVRKAVTKPRQGTGPTAEPLRGSALRLAGTEAVAQQHVQHFVSAPTVPAPKARQRRSHYLNLNPTVGPNAHSAGRA